MCIWYSDWAVDNFLNSQPGPIYFHPVALVYIYLDWVQNWSTRLVILHALYTTGRQPLPYIAARNTLVWPLNDVYLFGWQIARHSSWWGSSAHPIFSLDPHHMHRCLCVCIHFVYSTYYIHFATIYLLCVWLDRRESSRRVVMRQSHTAKQVWIFFRFFSPRNL
jgi:hypothetical protein